MPRPPKYTPARVKKIIEGLQSGMTRRAAAAYAGCSEDSIYTWLRDKRKASFTEQVREAEDIAESRYTTVLTKAAFGYDAVTEKTVVKKEPDGSTTTTTTRETAHEFDWRAAQFWLQRRRRPDYGETVVHTGPDGGAIGIDVGSPLDKLEDKLEQMAKRHADRDPDTPVSR